MAKENDVYRMIQAMVREIVDQQFNMPEPAIITSIDMTTYTVKAQLLYDEDMIVGPLRVCMGYAGNGYGITCMPQIDDEVLIVYHGGTINDGYVVGRLYGPDDPPPAFNNGEYKITHASGSTLLMDNDGNIVYTAKNGAQTTIGQDGTITTVNSKGSFVVKPSGEMVMTGPEATVDVMDTGEVKISNSAGSIDMNASGQFALTGPGGVELLTILNNLIQDMITAAPSFALYPSGSMNPALLTQITALQVQLATILQ